MNLSILPPDLPIPIDDGGCNHLLGKEIPDVSLFNQEGNLLKLRRYDSFRIVLYCYPMTGNPNKPLPLNWNETPGARGCTSQTCSIRDHYEDLIKCNALPIGLSTQIVDDIKEMVDRLLIPYDVLSDSELNFQKILNLPTFQIGDSVFIKRLTLIIEKSIIKNFFYPIFPPDLHIYEVLNWLQKN